MRIRLLPMILAVGMPTCSYFGGGGQPPPVQQTGQANQVAAAVPGGSASNGLFGFLPGGCPAITEVTRVEVNNWILHGDYAGGDVDAVNSATQRDISRSADDPHVPDGSSQPHSALRCLRAMDCIVSL